MAKSGLAPTNLVRLGLALNFSLFNFEILKSVERYISLCFLMKKMYTKFETNIFDNSFYILDNNNLPVIEIIQCM